jgi:uncharacterized protein (TIGR00730 family)
MPRGRRRGRADGDRHHLPHNRQAGARSRLIRNICVYCGSNAGINPAYAEAARQLGRALAEAGIGLVYGGGGLGLMGELARAAMAQGGRVTGVIPAFLTEKERMLRDADELIVVDDMHQRKKLMFEKADAFVALPGGIGTLEELVEQLTWAQLGRHTKPIVLVNVEGFWAPLLELLAQMHASGFIRPDMDVPFATVDAVDQVIATIRAAAKTQGEDATAVVQEKF